jgi:polyisoprenoid-binding protein YceI
LDIIYVLHRDIYWLGRQWAVTGYGIQAVSNKLEMKFDIEATRIWQDDLDASMLSEAWFDAADFAEALAVARRRALENPKTFSTQLSDER